MTTSTLRGCFILAVLILVIKPLLPGGAFAFGQSGADMAYLSRLQMTTPVRPNSEIRALWVVRDALTSLASVDRLVDFAEQTRFHIIFVQVRGRGDAYYQSSFVVPPDGLEAPLTDFDPLEYLLVRARRAGISVHAWINVLYVWSDPNREPPAGHVVREHPDWLLADSGGARMGERDVSWWQRDGIEGYYLSPSSPVVRQHLADVVRELVARYPLDGVHLDYIRFPAANYGFDPDARTEFALEYGVDPLDLRVRADDVAELTDARAVAILDSIYIDRRCQQVDSMVVAIREAAPGVALSAAVVADPEQARVEKGQDWVRWIQRRWVDFAVPMAYNHSPEGMRSATRMLTRMIGGDRFLIGIALHEGRDAFLEETLFVLREEQAPGFSLFSYNVLATSSYAASFIEEKVLDTIVLPAPETSDTQE